VLIVSTVATSTTPTDVFPNNVIPVVAVDWTFSGLNPEELEGRVTSVYDRVLTATVDNIRHIESTPPGTLLPLIINYSASSVPILQLGLSGQELSGQRPNDLGQKLPTYPWLRCEHCMST
jgi:hypothetical protein